MHVAKAYQEPGTPEEQSRRTFMANASIVMGGVISLVLGVPLVRYMIPGKEINELSGRAWSAMKEDDLKKLGDVPAKVTIVKHSQDGYFAPADSEDYVWGVKMNDAQFKQMQEQRKDLFSNPKGKVDYPIYTAGLVLFSSVCPHLGCRFAWDTAKTKFFCPCHNSEFERNGEHTAGPAPRGLDPLPLREQNGKAEVTWIRYASSTPDRMIVSFS